jgi:hypothetical protein
MSLGLRCEDVALEFKPSRQYPEIVKVFHSAFSHAQFDRGFKLFRNNALLGIGMQFGYSKFEERGKFQFL